ncbi:MAG: hypothetical protein WCY11_20870 [Novosphingobium sp.]
MNYQARRQREQQHSIRRGIGEANRLDQSVGAAHTIVVPQISECYALPSVAPARRLKTGRPELHDTVSRDWQNDYADFATRLKRELSNIESASARREALARMSSVLQSYKDHRHKQRSRKKDG